MLLLEHSKSTKRHVYNYLKQNCNVTLLMWFFKNYVVMVYCKYKYNLYYWTTSMINYMTEPFLVYIIRIK